MCVDPTDRKQTHYLLMEIACRNITDTARDIEHGEEAKAEALTQARTMARTFETFVESKEERSKVFTIMERGGDYDLTRYEHFVLVTNSLTQDDLRQYVLLLDAMADGKLAEHDKACEFHTKHGIVFDCKSCEMGVRTLKGFSEKLEARAMSAGRNLRTGCF